MVSIGQIAVGIILGIFGLFIALYSISLVLAVPSVWRGETKSVSMRSYGANIEVNVRNYPTAALSIFCLCFVGPLWFVLRITELLPEVLNLPFALVFLLGIILLPFIVIINAFNRPKFMVPPPHREKSGWVYGGEKNTDLETTNQNDGEEVDSIVAPTDEQSTGDDETAPNDDTTFVSLSADTDLNDVLADAEQAGGKILMKEQYDDGSYVAVVEDANGSQTVYSPDG